MAFKIIKTDNEEIIDKALEDKNSEVFETEFEALANAEAEFHINKYFETNTGKATSELKNNLTAALNDFLVTNEMALNYDEISNIVDRVLSSK